MTLFTAFFRNVRIACAWIVLAPLSASFLTAATAPVALPAAEGKLEALVVQFDVERESLRHVWNLPWSEARRLRLERFARDWQKRLQQQEFSILTQQGKIDYLLLRNELDADLNRLSVERRRLAGMAHLLPMREAIQKLEEARWRMETLDLEKAATAVAAIPGQIETLRERMERGRKEAKKAGEAKPTEGAEPSAEPLKVTPELAHRAAGAAGELRETLKSWFAYYDGYLPEFTWWLGKPHEEASKALEDYGKYLREEIAGLKGKEGDPLLGEPAGAAELQRQIALEMLPYTAEELIALGEKQLAWCEAEAKKASHEMGCGEDWKAALAKIKADHAPPGRQDLLVASCAREAIDFVKKHELLTIPPLCEETWRLTMLSAETQKTIPYVAYGDQKMLVAFARQEMKQEDKAMSMRGNNRHFTRIVTAHELIPGHHLQLCTTRLHRPYRALFSTSFFVEGWALYCELLLWEHGFGKTPEERLGMLFWRMHRSARIVVSLRFHLGQMKPSEMVDFLVTRVGHERFGATSEVRRYIGDDFPPLYQAAYMLGALQLQALRDELVGTGRMTGRQFNDTVLTYNSIPIELIRAGMLNLPLSPEMISSWKFAADRTVQ